MPTVLAPEVLTDPIGVLVGLVVRHEPSLNRATVTEVVENLAGGRAKRRRLAQALLDRPTVLADGRSPAPRAVADLLIALRKAGAMRISPPVCAECGKQLRTFQRRGEHWYCAVCGPVREPCAVCGNLRRVRCRDREQRPRCAQCPPDDGRDAVDLIVDVVGGVDPTLSPGRIAEAVSAAVPRAGQRQRLAWVLQERPDLLTGAGAQAPIPAVLRLIDQLCDAGAHAISRPACPDCRRVIHLHRPIGGQWLCRNCVAKTRAQPCSRCGAVREAAIRDERGNPLCPYCLINDPTNHEECIGCGRRRRVSVRTPDGPLCEACRPVKTMTCSICGREAPCYVSVATGQPWCEACRQRWAVCSGCGQDRPVRGGTLDQPLCAACTRDDPGFWRSCSNCGQPGRIRSGRCARCTIRQRLREVLGDETGQIRPHLQALHDALAATDRTNTVAAWLDGASASVLRGLDAGDQLTHAALDELPDGKPIEHLRSVLVAIGSLPPRDEHMARLERWITHMVTQRQNADERKLLHRYALWHVVRRLRGRIASADTTRSQSAAARGNIRAAVALLDWLAEHGLTLTTARQSDLEAWLASPQATHREGAGNFVRWARRQKLTRLDFAAVKWGGPTGIIDTETRWEQARWLLHDDTLKPEDRVAGLLVLLYAQPVSRIVCLTREHLDASDTQVRLRLGREPILLPEPLAGLVRQVAATRKGHATIGDPGRSLWLFPGGRPGRALSAFRMAERLNQLGIHCGQSRSAALFQLATDLPAAMLAKMLGIHIAVAVTWQRASAGDWTNYAAEVSRRARGGQRQ
ncbi:MAG TPA: hypothetical protein VJT31_38805 [Rugosimonospora sp.]|nr:hypothetical protein [Rugosimonospora sp.]